jgi:hypothetical protein
MSTANLNADDDQIIAATENWLEKAVIGLNLCPFAKAVHVKKQVRYVVSSATTPEALLEQLMNELQLLSDTDAEKVDTTLLIHPFVLDDFLDFNEFLDVADAAVEDMQLDGELQIASFHPQYQFGDTDVNDITNSTNRAPYPILQLLREESIDRAVEVFPEAEQIFEKNMETMEKLGYDGWDALDVGPAKYGAGGRRGAGAAGHAVRGRVLDNVRRRVPRLRAHGGRGGALGVDERAAEGAGVAADPRARLSSAQ